MLKGYSLCFAATRLLFGILSEGQLLQGIREHGIRNLLKKLSKEINILPPMLTREKGREDMKNIILALSLLSATSIMADEPKYMECRGINIKVTMDLSKAQAPVMIVSNQEGQVDTYANLQVQPHALGKDYTSCTQSSPEDYINCITFRMPLVNIFYRQEKFAFDAEFFTHTRTPYFATPQRVSGKLCWLEAKTSLHCLSATSPLSEFREE